MGDLEDDVDSAAPLPLPPWSAADVGGVAPLGRELPFLGAGDGPVALPPPPSPDLFMLLIMSRTELLRLAAAKAAAETDALVESEDDDAED